MAVIPILADPEPEAGAYPHSLLEAIPDPSAVVDTNGVIVAVNRHLVALIGRGSDELIGSPLRDYFADEALVDSHLRQGFAVGSVANHELTLRSGGGQRTVVSCDASTIKGGPSAPDRLLVVARDGAEQARASVLAALVQSADDAIVGMTLEDVITSWNSGAERLYGYAASEVVGRGFDVVVPEGARAAEARILQRVSAGKRVEPYEAERVGKDGTPVTVSVAISPIIDPDGRLVGIASMSRDLREARIAETRLRWMLEVAPDAIMGVDASGYIELVNAQCERLFGYQREELLGQPVEKVIPDGLRPVDAGQVAAGHELTTLHKDGSQVSVEISLSALETPGGRLTMAAVRDITDRKRIERQLREQNIALMLASQSKDNFLASMSHELRTPLNAIIGFTGTVLMRLPGPLNAEQEHQLRLVQTSGRHLLAIINDLLDLAKIESGRVQINRDLVDCRDLADEVVQSLQPLADGKGITLRIEAPDDGSAVAIADRRALGQILINLINNAIKFTDTGEVRVCLIPHPAPGEALRIAVHDTGPGILAADLSRVFHAFERSAATAKASEEGTGLGLHISQRLAELLGATITVSSVVGEGSTFAITLVEQ